MDTLLNADELAVQSAAAEFFATEATPARVRAAERSPERMDRALRDKVAELGWIGISLPEEVGGQGLPLSYLGLMFEEAGRRLAPIPLLSTVVTALVLARHGSAAQRAPAATRRHR